MTSNTSHTVRRTQEERRAQAEDALLDAAARLFARHGVERTSMADVGAAAGYSRGLANHHFGSRAELVERLARRAQAAFAARLGTLDADDPQAVARLLESLAERADPGLAGDAGVEVRALVTVASTYLAVLDEARAFLVLWGSALAEESALRPVFAADDALFRRGVRHVIALGQRNGTITPDLDAPAAATAVVGLLRGVAAQFQIDPDAADLDAARATCARFLTAALRP
ncbi:TetR/AcrR family transcriptional regulator [Actinomadura atramentaria]|uniref:TetR/AcrR family transcriptional regulator n=1 Tax=Actinomadura atramentaria TaxID=1990 RepID=UPI0003649062|nr:TetR/AcrR family transcriptional regulator [Actinomadura atramentaria]